MIGWVRGRVARARRRTRTWLDRHWVGPITKAFYNIGDGSDLRKRKDLDEIAANGAQIILLCEAGDRVKLLKSWCAARGWFYHPGDESPGAASTPILVRNDLLPCVDRWVTEESAASQDVGDPGAGPDHMKRKVTNGVVIRRRTRLGTKRRPLAVFVKHLLPSATRLRLPNAEKRRRIYREDIANTLATIRRTAGRGPWRAVVEIYGDFNAGYDDQLLEQMRAAGYRAVPTGPTHGHHTIDLALLRRLVRVIQVVVLHLSSDHHSIVITTR